jgi:Leucine-rich repeat (LRR) protein
VADVDLQNLGSLEYLDLSRNLIKEILPGTFLGMQSLKGLDFSVNVVRKVSSILHTVRKDLQISLHIIMGVGRK